MSDITRRFNAAARTYDATADVQAGTARRLLAFMPATPPEGPILEIGCGTGTLTAGLRHKYPANRIDAVDLSPAMLAVARRNLPGHDINWIAGDVRNLPGRQRYALITGSAALHWLHPLDAGMARLRHLLAHHGNLHAALMLNGTLCELHRLRRMVAPHKPPLAALPGIGEVYRAFAAAGLFIHRLHIDRHAAVYESAAVLLRSLHDQGVTGGFPSRGRRPLTRSELQKLTGLYDRTCRNAGGVFATYRTAYVGAAIRTEHG